jgi:hypothetical protein
MDGWNYFNYFTEIEEYFWKKRGAHLLVSPLDWAIMETWQKAGVPLEAVFKGIDRAFESYQRSRRGAGKPLKSLAYCTDAVIDASEEALEAAAGRAPKNGRPAAQPFSRDELRAYLGRSAQKIAVALDLNGQVNPALRSCLSDVSRALQVCSAVLEASPEPDLEDLERRLTVLDDKVHATLLSQASAELLLRVRLEMDRQLAAYRRKMKAEQLAMVERQYLQKRLLEEFRLPRLSLYYFS